MRNQLGIEFAMHLAARKRADKQARRIPWNRLLETRKEYVNWTELCFWARSIMEADRNISDWLRDGLSELAPGFIEYDLAHCKALPGQTLPLWHRLTDWINQCVFRCAYEEGWLEAVTFYAARDPRSQRAKAYWRQCRTQWKRKRLVVYPSFVAWKRAAAHCDYASLLRPEMRAVVDCSKRIPMERLDAAVECYIDWEAFAYWTRSSLEAGGKLPAEVEKALQLRCPGFLGVDKHAPKNGSPAKPEAWNRLLAWLEEQFFNEAKKEGWFNAVLLHARNHPRTIRTREYWDHWSRQWSQDPQSSYPPFEEWRKHADEFVDADPD